MPDSATAQHTDPKSDIEIARQARMRPVVELAEEVLGIPAEAVEPYGHHKAKIGLSYIESLAARGQSKLILVSAITPTPAGEGKTTTTVGLGDALNRIGKNALICLREPSLGPCFGMKGGAAGGGYAQVVPMEDINLHFTGDFHAIGAANNLLAAMIDNHVYWSNPLDIDTRRVTWRRAVDMNDRALRGVVTSLGGVANGFAREGGFDITVASEVMAILCLASDLDDLQRRLGNIVIGYRRDRTPVTARDLEANGAMAVLLKDAIKPNLVQTLENNPAFVHGGPFANIAHGCNSVIATRAAGKLADYVVTEAGFGADLGAEKFLDIKCRKGGLEPDLAVLVATVRALKMHGGVARSALGGEDARAVRAGGANMARHVANLRRFGLPVVVALNKFSADTAAEVGQVFEACAELRVPVVECDHWARGGEGAIALAEEVAGQIDADGADYRPLYPDDMPLWEKMGTVARTIYGAEDVVADDNVRKRIAELQDSGYGHFPVCMAKTQYSYTADATRMGAPSGFELPIREVRLCGGAEFVIAICGEIMTMPGLPRRPAATQIRLGADGHIEGLF